MKRFVYADNAATTPVSQTVLNAMLPYYTEKYGNPSSLYAVGREAKKALEEARENVANHLGALPNEIFFTSGGSEADNWAIKGVAHELAKKGKKHIITSKFEHHAVLHTTEALEKEGFEVTYLEVYENGIVKPEDVEKAIREDTALVTIMYANNEIGTIQPISEIGAICKKHGVLFHTDAVQAVGNVKINVKEEIRLTINFLKDYLKKNNIWFVENVYYEDVPFAFQTLLADGKIVTIPNANYHNYKRSGSIIQSLTQRHLDDLKTVFKEIRKYLKEEEIYDRYVFNYYKVFERFYNLLLRQIFNYAKTEDEKKEWTLKSIDILKEIIDLDEFARYYTAEEIRRHLQPYVTDLTLY